MSTPSQDRSLHARVAAHTRWSRCDDRTAATEPARRGMLGRFEREVDPDGRLAPHERAVRAEHARKAYFIKMALTSARARRKSRELAAEADAADAKLRDAGTAA